MLRPLEAIEHKPQPEHGRLEVPQARVVERARFGDVGEQLEVAGRYTRRARPRRARAARITPATARTAGLGSSRRPSRPTPHVTSRPLHGTSTVPAGGTSPR